ncbi:hypothetical protein KB575_00565 [Streptococcus canis]|uniref:hypothetical protein n=1 Tax=Streptococcus canis TaxID=1329 RepID=UPI00294985E8|nr:hypothetical protein [Streptococcus canis]MDV5987561.1 hypothetical protein [Streptococcus canis]
MSVKVKFNRYSDLSGRFRSKNVKLFDLPKEIIQAIDSYFDGMNFKLGGELDPFNVDFRYRCLSDKELLSFFGFLSKEVVDVMIKDGHFDDYIDEYREDIIERMNDYGFVLGYANNAWHILKYE